MKCCAPLMVRNHRLWAVAVLALGVMLLAAGVVHAAEPAPGSDGPVTPFAVQPAATYQTFLPAVRADKRPNSFQLIDAALERGELDDETALVYEVFAIFGDLRLPVRFRGDNSEVIDHLATVEAMERFSSLSQAAQDALAPFLVPPIYKGSWYDLRMQAQTTVTRPSPAAGPSSRPEPGADPHPILDRCKEVAQGLFIPLESEHFVVWYPPNDVGHWIWAQQTSQNLEERIYPVLTGLMSRTPLSDAGLGCNPYDGRLDVYIVPGLSTDPDWSGVYAAVYTHPDAGCKKAPTFMLVLSHSRSDVNVIAHEFFHMIQFGYNPVGACLGETRTRWWIEATADWAMDAFEEIDPAPDAHLEHDTADDYLETAYHSLVTMDRGREYGAYLFPFYLVRRLDPDRPQLIAEIFAALEKSGGEDLYAVIDARIDGGIAQRWPDFALHNLNLPLNDAYEQWDDFKLRWQNWRRKQASLAYMVLGGRPQRTFPLETPGAGGYSIADLAVEHLDVTLAGDVRLFAFANTFTGKPDVVVQALGQPAGGEWQGPFDWTPRKWNLLCRDRKEEDFWNVIIMMSNSDWKDFTAPATSDGPPLLVGSDLGCARWQGTAEWRLQGESTGADTVHTYSLVGRGDVTWALDKMEVKGDSVAFLFKPVAGEVTWSHVVDAFNQQTGQHNHCEVGGSKALDSLAGQLMVGETLGGSTPNRQFFGAGVAFLSLSELCPGVPANWTTMAWLQTGDVLPWQGGDGGVLKGSVTETITGDGYSDTITSTWDFAVPDP